MRTVGAEHGTVTRESGGSRPSTGPLLCVSIVDFLVVVFFSFVCDAARGVKAEGGGGSPRSSNHMNSYNDARNMFHASDPHATVHAIADIYRFTVADIHCVKCE